MMSTHVYSVQIEMRRGFACEMKLATIILPLALLMVSCGMSTREEISRFPSPDRKVEAVWCRNGGGGPTTTFTYTLFIAPSGREPDGDDVLLLVDHIDSLEINWGFGRVLEITYGQARIHHFRNFWLSRDVDNTWYGVELRLNPRNDQHSLSPEDRWIGLDSTSLEGGAK